MFHLCWHTTPSDPHTCQSGSPFIARTGTGFGTNATLFTSTLKATATPALNGTLVECFGPAFSRGAGNLVGNSILQILGELCHSFNLYVYTREQPHSYESTLFSSFHFYMFPQWNACVEGYCNKLITCNFHSSTKGCGHCLSSHNLWLVHNTNFSLIWKSVT